MTRDQLNETLDAMAAQAGGDSSRLPGLITVQTDCWVGDLAALRGTCTSLQDGMRHRDIQIHVGSDKISTVLTRADAGGRGTPYRDLTPLF